LVEFVEKIGSVSAVTVARTTCGPAVVVLRVGFDVGSTGVVAGAKESALSVPAVRERFVVFAFFFSGAAGAAGVAGAVPVAEGYVHE
jgi:hypothetical protein